MLSALELCGEHCDVYLMWPEPKDQIAERMKAVHQVAENIKERTITAFVFIWPCAIAKPKRVNMRNTSPPSSPIWQALSSRIYGQALGARSGCAAALVGSTDQVMSEIEAYQKTGIRAFIFSGYPHLDECKHFGNLVLPHLNTCSLPHEYGRVSASTPMTPLGAGERR